MSASSRTTTVTVNAAFLQEIKEVNQVMWESLSGLESMCSRPISLKGQCFEFLGRLKDFRDQLALHFALEEAYGYFDGPLEVAPRISVRAETLRSEHRTLYQELVRVVEQAESLLYERKLAALTAVVPVAFERFTRQLRDHEANENALLQEAWGEDLGVGD